MNAFMYTNDLNVTDKYSSHLGENIIFNNYHLLCRFVTDKALCW